MELTKDNMLDTISGITKDLDGVTVDKDGDVLNIRKGGKRLFSLGFRAEYAPCIWSEYTFQDGSSACIMSVTFWTVVGMEIERFSRYFKRFTSVCEKAHKSISDFISGKSRTDEEIADFMSEVQKTAKKEYCI